MPYPTTHRFAAQGRPRRSCKRQTLYDLLPIEKIENGILHTTDDRYIKILEIEPINFPLRSPPGAA